LKSIKRLKVPQDIFGIEESQGKLVTANDKRRKMF